MRGTDIPRDDFLTLAKELSNMTGLPESYWLSCRLRPEVGKVNKILLKDQGLVFGRLDTRITAHDVAGTSDVMGFDPSYDGLLKAPYAAIMYDYMKNKLQFDYGALTYDIISGRTYPWDFDADNQFLDNTDLLSRLMVRNPHLKVWISAAVFDLGVPYFSVQYSIQRLWLPDALKENLRINWYEGGHMFYHDEKNLDKFRKDAMLYFQSFR